MSMRSSPGDGVPAWLPCSASRPRRGDLSGRIRRRSSSGRHWPPLFTAVLAEQCADWW